MYERQAAGILAYSVAHQRTWTPASSPASAIATSRLRSIGASSSTTSTSRGRRTPSGLESRSVRRAISSSTADASRSAVPALLASDTPSVGSCGDATCGSHFSQSHSDTLRELPIAAIARSAGECSAASCSTSDRATVFIASLGPATPTPPAWSSEATIGTSSIVRNRSWTPISAVQCSARARPRSPSRSTVRDGAVPSPSRRSRKKRRSGRRDHSSGVVPSIAASPSLVDGASRNRDACSI